MSPPCRRGLHRGRDGNGQYPVLTVTRWVAGPPRAAGHGDGCGASSGSADWFGGLEGSGGGCPHERGEPGDGEVKAGGGRGGVAGRSGRTEAGAGRAGERDQRVHCGVEGHDDEGARGRSRL
jgi:hypothetical protein